MDLEVGEEAGARVEAEVGADQEEGAAGEVEGEVEDEDEADLGRSEEGRWRRGVPSGSSRGRPGQLRARK